MTTSTTPTPPAAPTRERTLILVRHAKAEYVPGNPDHDRKLTSRGREDARAVGAWLSESSRSLVPDLAICSTAERTRQTLDGVRAGGASPADMRFDERVYEASAVALLDVLREVPDSVQAVLMIGHAPSIPVLTTALAHENSGSTEVIEQLSKGFPTSGLAVLTFEGRWAGLAPESADLRYFVVPGG